MATTTPFLGLRKPTNTGGANGKGDPIDVVADISDNMEDIDTFASTTDARFGSAAQDFESALANFTSTSFTETFTGSNTPAGTTFEPPTSGKVLIHCRSWLDNNTATARTFISNTVRTGGVIGSGTIVLAAADTAAIHNVGPDDIEAGGTFYLEGLTPDTIYNCRNAGRVTSGIGESQNRELIIQPTY